MAAVESGERELNAGNLEKQIAHLRRQIWLLKTHCIRRGIPIVPDVAEAIAEAESSTASVDGSTRLGGAGRLPELMRAHELLLQLTLPATPESIEWSMPDPGEGGMSRHIRRDRLRFFCVLIGFTVLFLGFFLIMLCITEGPMRPPLAGSSMAARNEVSGMQLQPAATPKYLFLLLSGGGLGAALYNLHHVRRQLTRYTFYPAFRSRYYLRLVLGPISGLILGYFGVVFLTKLFPSAVQSESSVFQSALLALVGGFVADVVPVMLTNLGDAMKTLFRGKPLNRQVPNDTKAKRRSSGGRSSNETR